MPGTPLSAMGPTRAQVVSRPRAHRPQPDPAGANYCPGTAAPEPARTTTGRGEGHHRPRPPRNPPPGTFYGLWRGFRNLAWGSFVTTPPRWRWDLNPRTGCPVTRFRVLRTHVQERSSASTPCSTSPAATFPEPSRTTANETKTETTSDAASSRPRVLTSDSYRHVGGTPFLRMRTAHCPGASGSRL